MIKTGAQIIVETLIEQGVTDVFGYPGGQVLHIYDALYEYQDKINHVLTAHEQGASHAADGYFRATGKTGVVISTSGPGATNLVTGIATAMLDSVPLIAITGNVPCSLIGKDSFQEIDIVGVTMPITKHNFFVNHIEDLADTIREAFRIARSGRPGPVLIDIPKDVQTAKYEFENCAPKPRIAMRKARDEEIDRAVALIKESKRPYIYLGGGAVGANISTEVQDLAEKIDAAIGCTLMGITAVPTSNPRFLGMQGMHGHYASTIAQDEADLIIALGVRFSDRATGNKARYAKNSKILHIDPDFAEINKNIPADEGIICDLHDAFLRIMEKITPASNPEWVSRVKELKAEELAKLESDEKLFKSQLSPRAAICTINQNKNADTPVVTDVGQHQMWAAQFCEFEKKRTFLSSGGLGTMGFGLGAAIGAQVGTGKRTILVTGDGSFGMNLNEVATAVKYNLPITIVVMNNGVLGMVRQWQTLFFNKHYSNTTRERKTDFVKLAEAFGAAGARATTPEELDAALKAAQGRSGPTIIDCVIDKDEFVLPMLPPGGSVDDIIVTKEELNLE
ncbi:MAG: biosynthetic-type acetolactate synthase large subunit [Clostridia bacterium]|nr:biosynthetic-type acetolactate synthase large subunit [Clostridia bacterium]